jgi:putative selenate reductase molybdopterin-binding subunit
VCRNKQVFDLESPAGLPFECDIVYTNTPVAGAFRGYGCPQGFFAQETLVDEIAHELGIDPIEFRLKNAIRLGDTDELSAVLGEGRKGLPRVVRSCGLPECLERGAEAIGWSGKRNRVNDPRSHLKRGVGVAATMQGSGIAGVDWASALLKMSEDGSFHLMAGASDVGAGADTVLAQIAAETLGVTMDKITVTSGDTDFTPFDVGAYASSTTIISGGAVKKAAEKVREQVLSVAAKMLDVLPTDLECRDNKVSAK